jgi:hypothetical protein
MERGDKKQYCHYEGKWHTVPFELIKLVANLKELSSLPIEYTTSGGNKCVASLVIRDGVVRAVEFCTIEDD